MKNNTIPEENPQLNMIPERCCCPLHCKILEAIEEIRIEVRQKYANEMGQEEWLDSLEVSQLLHVSIRTITNMRNNGLLKYSQFGRKYYYLKSDIMEILKDNYMLNKIGYFKQKS